MGITMAVAAIGSLGVGAYEASTQAGLAGQQEGMAATTFAEEQWYQQQLKDLYSNPGSITSMPGYQFAFGQGEQAVTRQYAAGQALGSGQLGTALVQYGQGYAENALSQQENFLLAASGLAPASPAQYAQGASQSQNLSFNQLGALAAGGGYLANRAGWFGAGTPAGYSGMGSPGGGGLSGYGAGTGGGTFDTAGGYSPFGSPGYYPAPSVPADSGMFVPY